MPDFYDNANKKLWFSELVTIPESERANMLDRINKLIGTRYSELLNRQSDTMAYAGAPLATRLAGQRGLGQQAMMATEQGAFDVNQYVTGQNIQGYQWLLGQANQQEQFNQQMKQQRLQSWLSLLGQVGQAAGYAVGGGALGGGGQPGQIPATTWV